MTRLASTKSTNGPREADTDVFARAREALSPENGLRDRRLREAAALLRKGRFETATSLVRNFLNDHPGDARAMHLLAETGKRQGRIADAMVLLEQCVQCAPDFLTSRYVYANLLMMQNKPEAALVQAEVLMKREPRNPLFRARTATILEKLGNYSAAATMWRELTDDYPSRQESWERYGNALRAMGLVQDAVAVYRRMIEFNSRSGLPWWHLADMKTFRFDTADVEKMEFLLGGGGLTPLDRTYFHFSLGKAFADLGLYEKAFSHYTRGNALRRIGVTYDPAKMTAYVVRCKSVFSGDMFRARAGSGCDSRAPIFLVGMPRSGSTLVEQILASHSQIEGTGELADLAVISGQLTNTAIGRLRDYPGLVADLDVSALARLGESYLERARAHRKLCRPLFADKMGANFAHVGLIQLILPKAKIVDVRRHPLACCFSGFAQIFPGAEKNAYRLADLGSRYRDYVELMAHFDRVLPGRVLRIHYERLIADPEAEIRRLLDYLGIAFEGACLRFYETDRAIATVSAEQVRQPLYKDALEQWRNYESWLGPLKAALGPVVETYPAVPAFD